MLASDKINSLFLSLSPFVLLQVSPLAAIIIPWEFTDERHVTPLTVEFELRAAWLAFL